MIQLNIPFQIIGFNKVIEHSKNHYTSYNNCKKKFSKLIQLALEPQKQQKISKKSVFLFKYQYQNNLDHDNITWAKKIILDTLSAQPKGILPNDNHKYINTSFDFTSIDKQKDPYISILIVEQKEFYTDPNKFIQIIINS